MHILIVLSALGTIASLTYYLGATFAALRFAYQAGIPAPPLNCRPPRVAMLKPLYSLDAAHIANLESFLQADYPAADVVVGVSTVSGWAADRLAELTARYPDKRLIVVTDAEPGCANRKVAKLIRMVEQVPEAEVFVLSDGDIVVERDYLRRLVAELAANPGVGVVTCAYRAHSAATLAGRFDAMFINTDFAPMVMLAEMLEPLRHAYGATIAIDRTALEAIGGFRALKDLLADDFFLGRLAAERGFKIKLSRTLVSINCPQHHLAEFWSHQLRWARTYRTTRPESLATIAIQGPFWVLVLVLASHFSPPAVEMFGVVIAARLAMAAVLLDRVLGAKQMLADLLLVPIKDLAMTGIWFASLASNEVTWGGRRFRILSGGAMREVDG
ncbi:MAG TPA: glycosyltransferase [Candidatus Binataceae bacterium]|nr:glycosyltransferase [Candidatus Binataceae bacterium]